MKKSFAHRAFTYSAILVITFGPVNSFLARDSLQSAQEIKPSNTAVQNDQHVRLLEVGKPIEREMKGGETHAYSFPMTSDQYLYAVVDQRGIDVVVTLFGPDGKQVVKVDGSNRTQGPELIWAITEVSGNYQLEVRSLRNDVKLGRYEAKIEELREANEQDRKRVAAERAFTEANRLSESKESRRKAIELFKEALQLFRDLRDKPREDLALGKIGYYYLQLHENQESLKYLNQALQLARQLRDSKEQAATLLAIGEISFFSGEYLKSIGYLEESLQHSRDAKDPELETTILIILGSSCVITHASEKALDYLNRALSLSQALNNCKLESAALRIMGTAYMSVDKPEDAKRCFDKANKQCLEVGNNEEERNKIAAEKAMEEGFILLMQGSKESRLGAITKFEEALQLWEALNDKYQEAITLSTIGAVYYQLGEIRKGLDYLNQALPSHHALRNRPMEAVTLVLLGELYHSLGDKEKELNCYRQALSLTRGLNDHYGESASLYGLARVKRDLNNLTEARTNIEQSLRIIEIFRVNLLSLDLRTSYFGLRQDFYEFYINLLMALHKRHTFKGYDRMAFQASERARARTFLDQLGNTHVSIRKSSDAQLIELETKLRLELINLDRDLTEEEVKSQSQFNANVVSSIESKLATKQREYEELLVRIQRTNPEYASLHWVNPVTLSDARKFLDKETTLLSYFITTERALAFVIRRDSFRAIELPAKEVDLKAAITWFRSFASLRDPQPEKLKQLHSWLIAPIEKYVKTRVVGIIPHGVLHYLPFAALTDGRRYFGDDHTLFYLPSVSVLPFIQEKSKPVGNQLLAIAQSQAEGLPTLQHADEEGNVVASVYNTNALTTDGASKSAFLKRARDYSIIHIAAHAELNTASPLFSRIMLGADKDDTGGLHVREIYDLDLSKASLVVLSGCETQLGAHGKGDDIVGLNRAFIYAGTPTVIASLWTVDDESTSYLMKAFYTHLKQGMSKAEALRAAQSDTREKYPHPYYWAAFILTGDPGLN